MLTTGIYQKKWKQCSGMGHEFLHTIVGWHWLYLTLLLGRSLMPASATTYFAFGKQIYYVTATELWFSGYLWAQSIREGLHAKRMKRMFVSGCCRRRRSSSSSSTIWKECSSAEQAGNGPRLAGQLDDVTGPESLWDSFFFFFALSRWEDPASRREKKESRTATATSSQRGAAAAAAMLLTLILTFGAINLAREKALQYYVGGKKISGKVAAGYTFRLTRTRTCKRTYSDYCDYLLPMLDPLASAQKIHFLSLFTLSGGNSFTS